MLRFSHRSAGRPTTAVLVTALVVVLAALEVWALSLPLLAEWPAGLPAGWTARDSSILFDLILVLPALTFLLVWAWRRPAAAAPAGMQLPPWLRAWLRPRRLLYLLAPRLIAQLLRLDVGLGGILAAVAGLAVIGEVFAFGVLAVKLTQLARTTRRASAEGYTFPTALTIAAGKTFGALPLVPALRLAIAELAQLYYLTAGWLVKRRHPGARTFTYHRRRDETLMIAFALVITIEAVPLHVVVHHYSAVAAWILTGLHAYSLLWPLGQLAAARQRPHLLSAGRLRLTDGLWREAVVKLSDLCEVTDARGLEEPPQPDAGFGSRTDVLLELGEPVLVYGMFGGQREVRSIGLALDDADGFLEALTSAVPESHEPVTRSRR